MVDNIKQIVVLLPIILPEDLLLRTGLSFFGASRLSRHVRSNLCLSRNVCNGEKFRKPSAEHY